MNFLFEKYNLSTASSQQEATGGRGEPPPTPQRGGWAFPPNSTPALRSTGPSAMDVPMDTGREQLGEQQDSSEPSQLHTPRDTASSPAPSATSGTSHDASRIHGRPDDDDESGYNIQPRARLPGQLVRSINQEKAQKQGLTAEQVSDVVRFCELSPVDMLIDLKIHLFKNENELLRRFLRIFVRHPDFATRMKAYVAAALLAPIAPAYLDQVYTSLALHLEKNVEGLVGLSPSCRRDPADWMLVKSVLANDLSAERSSMKRKIDLAIQNKLDIYAFTQSMMSHDVRPKQAHWARFAWLRKRTIQYRETKPRPKNYWRFIDEELKAIRVGAWIDHPNSETGRKLAETTFFTQILNADIVAYPITSGAVAKRTFTNEGLTELQVSVENAVRGIVLDDTVVRPDDAPVEEEDQEDS